MTNRRNFLGYTAAAIGAMPFAGTALAQASNSPTATRGGMAPATATGYGAATGNAGIDVISLTALEEPFKAAISEAGYVFVSGAKGDEWTLRENRRAMEDFRLVTHRLTGVSPEEMDISVEILG